MAGVPVEGIVGRGKAGVFGGSVNPLNIYLAHQANQERLKGLRAKDEADQRDKLVDDLRKFNPDKVWEPFYDEVNRHVQTNVRDKFYELRDKGLPIAAISRVLDKEKGDANTLVNKINWQKAQWEDHNHRIDQEVDDGNFIPGYYNKKLNDQFFNGKYAKPSAEIDTSNLDEIYKDSKGYNVASIVNRFMDSLPDKINAHETEVWGKLGITYDIQKTKDKLGLQMDANGNVILDPRTGKPAIAMTDDVFLMAKSNPYLKQIVEDNLGQDAPLPKQREFLTGLLKGQNPVDIQNSIQLGHKIDQQDRRYFAYGSGFSHPIADLEARDERLQKIVTEPRHDLLEGVNDEKSDMITYYSSDPEGKKVVEQGSTQKPRYIAMAYVGQSNGEKDNIDYKNMSPEERISRLLVQQAKTGKVIKTKVFDISTDEGKKRAKIAMSLRLDNIDTKRSIGEEFSNFQEAKYKPSKSKKTTFDPNDPL